MHLRMAGGVALAKGLTVTPAKWSTAHELRAAFESIRKARPDALLLVPTFKSAVYRQELVPEIRRLRVPSVGGYGGSYTVTLVRLWYEPVDAVPPSNPLRGPDSERR